MGFIVNTPIISRDGHEYENFYVRIENCLLNKVTSTLMVVLAHYDSFDSARLCIGDYLEDDGDASGQLGTTLMVSGSTELMEYPMHYEYNLTSTEIIPTETIRIVNEPSEVEYVDFDEDGNEYTATKTEYFDVGYPEIIDIVKTKRTIGDITDNVYEYGYTLLKQTYGELFGVDKIIDEI